MEASGGWFQLLPTPGPRSAPLEISFLHGPGRTSFSNFWHRSHPSRCPSEGTAAVGATAASRRSWAINQCWSVIDRIALIDSYARLTVHSAREPVRPAIMARRGASLDHRRDDMQHERSVVLRPLRYSQISVSRHTKASFTARELNRRTVRYIKCCRDHLGFDLPGVIGPKK